MYLQMPEIVANAVIYDTDKSAVVCPLETLLYFQTFHQDGIDPMRHVGLATRIFRVCVAIEEALVEMFQRAVDLVQLGAFGESINQASQKLAKRSLRT